jgi:bifunctional DNase/RNase
VRELPKEAIDLNKMLSGKIFFQESGDDEEVFHQRDLILLTPYGVSMSTDPQRPFLLLKDVTQQLTLPVSIGPLEAGVTLSQSNKSALPTTPHRFTEVLMKSLDLEIKQCVFVQIKGPVQYVRLYLSGHPKTNSLKLRADEVMSLCLHLNVPLYATHAFINKSRLMSTHIEGLTEGLLKNQKMMLKDHPYLM